MQQPAEVKVLRISPYSTKAEQSVLGALMLNNDAWFDVADVLTAADFYGPRHQLVFEAIAALAGDRQPLDAVTVLTRLESVGLLEKVGGVSYLAELIDGTPGASNVAAYAQIVRELADIRRRLSALDRDDE